MNPPFVLLCTTSISSLAFSILQFIAHIFSLPTHKFAKIFIHTAGVWFINENSQLIILDHNWKYGLPGDLQLDKGHTIIFLLYEANWGRGAGSACASVLWRTHLCGPHLPSKGSNPWILDTAYIATFCNSFWDLFDLVHWCKPTHPCYKTSREVVSMQ